ncbi:MAG: glycosyltransferase family 2 protein [Parvularculaceae bacterium]
MKELLSRPDMLQLAQRIGSDFHLTPLSREEVHAYIDARLTIAGARRRIFTEKAMDLVAEQSRGVPRVINVIADTALVYAFSAEDLVVDEETIRSVVRDKLEYGVFGLANSPDLKLSEKRADASEKKTNASFLREVRFEPDPDGSPDPVRAPAPTRVEPMDAPRVLRAAGAKGGPRLAAAPEVVEDDEEDERAAIPFGGPSLYSNLDAAPFARPEADFAPAVQEPPVEAGAVAAAATMEELGIIIVGGDADAAATAPEGAHLVFVAADDVAQETAKAAGVDVVEIADGAASGGRARNAGYRRLKKIAPGLKFVHFVDAADTLDPEWLGRALRFMARRPEVAVLEGEIDEGDEARSVFQRVRETAARKLDGEIQAAGPTALFRAEAFEAAGGFRSDILVDETADLCLRLRRRGAHVWRLDDVMAYRIEHRMTFGEYWRRTRENGFQYAAGAALHGAPPEHFCVTEQARAVMWGMVFPAVVVFAAVAAAVAAFVLKTIGDPLVIGAGVLAVGGVIYFAKIFVTAFRLGPFRSFSWTYGFVSTIGHFAEFLGVARYWFGGKPQPSSRRSA